MKNLENSDFTLKLFIPLYAAGIIFQLLIDMNFNTTSITDSCSVVSAAGVSPTLMYYAVVGGIVISAIAHYFKKYLWLIPAVLYFFFFRDFVSCQKGPEAAYTPWNHAIVFWVLLTLGFQHFLGSSRTVFLIKFYILFSYFAGGIVKLRNGLEWMNGKTLQYYFLERTIDLNLPYAWNFVSSLWQAKAYSIATVILEILIPVAFFSKTVEWLYVFGMVVFHVFCWYVLKLRWMNYYGWTYLIYLSILIQILVIRKQKRPE